MAISGFIWLFTERAKSNNIQTMQDLAVFAYRGLDLERFETEDSYFIQYRSFVEMNQEAR